MTDCMKHHFHNPYEIPAKGALQVILLNIRSLKGHAIDLQKFPSIAFADAIILTERQSGPCDDLKEYSI